MKTVAELIVDALSLAGVQRVYGVAGDSLNGVTDDIRTRKGMVWVPVRHEETAAFAAGAEAQLTGKLAVCAGSCGPGNLHLINGLYDCHRNRVPVLAIAAHIPSQEIGSNYFQETHPEHLFKECSHYCELISQPSQAPRVVEIAIQTALARGGVSVIVVPGDVALREAVNQELRIQSYARARSSVRPDDATLDEIAGILNHAKSATILAGAGCQGAHDELVRTAARLRSPVVHALRGKEFVEHDNPYDVGMTGLLGFSSGYHAMMDSDVLLMLGTDFPYQQFYPKKAKILQIDSRPEQIGRRSRVDLGAVGDVRETLSALVPRLEQKDDSSRHLERSLEHYRKARKGLDDLAVPTPGQAIHPQYLARMLDQVAPDDAVFTVDVGTPVIWAARYLTMNGKRRLIGSFNHGSMANALPQAIGAQASHPGRCVITLSGDGGLSMLMGDLLTLRQANMPVKLVVFDNGTLGFVEMEMKATGFLEYGVSLDNPDFAKVAEAVGILGIRVEKPEDVRPALEKAMAHPGPVLVDVVVARQELAMPPSIKLDQIVDFNLYLMKAILDGRGDRILDLARTNLFH